MRTRGWVFVLAESMAATGEGHGRPKIPEGIRLVVVNGKVVCKDGSHTGAGSGRMLRYEP